MLACQTSETSLLNDGRVEVARLLIQSTSPMHLLIKDKDGLDALAYASKSGSTALVQLLLSLPAERFPDSEAESEMWEAWDRSGREGAPEDYKSGHSRLHILLRTVDKQGNTPLHHASAWGHLKTARVLVDAGLSATAPNNAGWTPLQYSATVAAEVYLRNLWRDKVGDPVAGSRPQGSRAPSRADVGGVGATGRKYSEFKGSASGPGKMGGKLGVRMVESDRSDDEDEEGIRGRDQSLNRARTFT
jgi:hypothetical protein